MNMRAVSSFEAERIARCAVTVDKARLASSLRSISEADGFPKAVEAAQQALRSLAADLREEGVVDVGSWIG